MVREPNGVNLRCKADGYPLATIRWFHNGTEIPVCKTETSSTGCVGGRYQVAEDRNSKFSYVESYLMIKNTKYPRDHGNYTCVANNSELQNATKDVEISVYCMSCRNPALIVIFRVQTYFFWPTIPTIPSKKSSKLTNSFFWVCGHSHPEKGGFYPFSSNTKKKKPKRWLHVRNYKRTFSANPVELKRTLRFNALTRFNIEPATNNLLLFHEYSNIQSMGKRLSFQVKKICYLGR